MGSTSDLTYYWMRERTRLSDSRAARPGVDDEAVPLVSIDPSRSS